MYRLILSLVGLLILSPALAEAPKSFSKAKKVLASEIYDGHEETFYCSCNYAEAPHPTRKNKTRLTPLAESCGLAPRKNANRSGRIEWEHVVPAWEFGHQLQCWQDGGRKACKKNPKFKQMEADMVNLVPAVGELNGDRSNFRFGMIEGEARAYGACDFEVDFKGKIAEPPEEKRGDIARIYFYMVEAYGLKLSSKQRKLFEAWNKLDPEDDWERERLRRIERVINSNN